ncbi:MAG: hypothetical protein RLZZ417_811, partial [Bacteroidota bacterium]
TQINTEIIPMTTFPNSIFNKLNVQQSFEYFKAKLKEYASCKTSEDAQNVFGKLPEIMKWKQNV